jgi:hypothetical protein
VVPSLCFTWNKFPKCCAWSSESTLGGRSGTITTFLNNYVRYIVNPPGKTITSNCPEMSSSAHHSALSGSGLVVSNASVASPLAGSHRSSSGAGAGGHCRRSRRCCGGFWFRMCSCGCVSCSYRQQTLGGLHKGFTCFCRCYQPKNLRPRWLNRFHAFTKSIVWRILYIFFSIFLLFGSSIQDLLVGPDIDIAFEVIRNIMLAYFILDMMIRCVTDKEYFVCTVGGEGSESATTTIPTTRPSVAGYNNATSRSTRYSTAHHDARDMHPSCTVGSFLFWCDVVSTLAILYDLSYVNNNANGLRQVEIGLNSDGVPVSQETIRCVLS